MATSKSHNACGQANTLRKD